MLASSFLDTAIGIIFVFLMLSLIASVVNEIIFALFNMRGRVLLDGISTLFYYDVKENPKAKWLVDQLYNHGQVFGLFKGKFDVDDPNQKRLPSYIPATNFALAFLGGVLPAAAAHFVDEDQAKAANLEAHKKQAMAFVEKMLADAATPLPADPTDKAALAHRAKQVKEAFHNLAELAKQLAEDPTTDKVGKPLLAMLVSAENDLGKLKTNLETWYNNAMDRVSGWYKSYTQWMLFGIGIVLAVALNANTVAIVKQLSHDPVLRESLVAAAQKQIEKGLPGATATPQAPPGGKEEAGHSAGPTGKSSDDNPYKKLASQVNEVEQLGIPLGWSGGLPQDEQLWGILGGWLLTAIAVSLGAPFWFDLLNKFMVARSTIKPQEKSKEGGTQEETSLVLVAGKP